MIALPRVVACMPAWNSEALVERTLASLAAQTYENLEILVSDDASTDRTAAICERFAAGDSRFRLMRQTKRHGWIGNTNLLLAAAQGEYAFFAFHDDPVEPTYVARLVEALETHQNAVLAFADVDGGGRGVLKYCELEDAADRLERARRVVLRWGQWWIPNRGLFRLALARSLGGMRRHLAGEYEADHPWLLRLALLGEFVRIPEVLVHKSFRDDSLSGRWNKNPQAWQLAGVLLGAAREVQRVRPPLGERLVLYKEVCKFGLWALMHRQVF
jgi:glycosyltransferase involved in cell wall biosynthesis